MSASATEIPLFKVFIAPPEELDTELLRVVHSGYVTQGPKVEAFEEGLRGFFHNECAPRPGAVAPHRPLRLFVYWRHPAAHCFRASSHRSRV